MRTLRFSGLLLALLLTSSAFAAQTPSRPMPPPGPGQALVAPGVTPALVPGAGQYLPGAQSLLPLLRFSQPGLLIFLPFDAETFDRSGSVPMDLGRHPIANVGGYMQYGRLRQSLRFGPFNPAFLAVSPAPNTISLLAGPQCTIAAWILPERLGGLTGQENATIVSRGATLPINSVAFALTLTPNGNPALESRIMGNSPQAGPWARQAAQTLTLRQWQHVCAVFNQGLVQFYIDGQPVGQAQAPAGSLDIPRDANAPVFVGVRFADDATRQIRDPFFGLLDDVVVFSRALTPQEIAFLASDIDRNGIADYWDARITGRPPTAAPTPAPTPAVPLPPTAGVMPVVTPYPFSGQGNFRGPMPTPPPANYRSPRVTAPGLTPPPNQPPAGNVATGAPPSNRPPESARPSGPRTRLGGPLPPNRPPAPTPTPTPPARNRGGVRR